MSAKDCIECSLSGKAACPEHGVGGDATLAPLKPCPFCGCSGELERSDPNCAWITCANCGAETNAMASPKGAVDVWNMRWAPSETASPAAAVYGPERQDYPGGPIYRVGSATGVTLPAQPSETVPHPRPYRNASLLHDLRNVDPLREPGGAGRLLREAAAEIERLCAPSWDAERCPHGVWRADHCWACTPRKQDSEKPEGALPSATRRSISDEVAKGVLPSLHDIQAGMEPDLGWISRLVEELTHG